MEIDKNPGKCSAVSTMERSMPTSDYSMLTAQLRQLILKDIEATPERFSKDDVEKAKNDEWFIARYLLRVKLDLPAAHHMLRKSMEFRNSPTLQIREFPDEFYKIGALFEYEPDRRGNYAVYLRIKVHQKIALVQPFLKAFLHHAIECADKKAGGKGIVLVFDCQGAGVANCDTDLLFFIITTLVNYFPKGLSYMLVHELPWIMRSLWTIARAWLSEDHRELVKFSDHRTIYEYFKEENLPDFLGGTCKRDYRAIPGKSMNLSEAAKRWNLDEDELYRIKKKFAQHFLPEDGA